MPFCKKETDVLTLGQMTQDTRHSASAHLLPLVPGLGDLTAQVSLQL